LTCRFFPLAAAVNYYPYAIVHIPASAKTPQQKNGDFEV
jgi:hypothetical protein